VAGHDLGASKQGAHPCGGDNLPGMRSHCDEVSGKRGVGAQQRLDAHRGGEVRGGEQPVQVGRGEHQHAEHPVGAVDQGEAFLLGERYRGDPGRAQRLPGRVHHPSGVPDGPLAGERERHRSQRREVTGAAQRAVLGHDRSDPGVEQAHQRHRRRRPPAGTAGCQRAQPQQGHCPDDLALHLGSRTSGVRPDQRLLQHRPLRQRDVPRGQRPEAGGDSVVRTLIRGQRLDVRTGGRHCLIRLRGQLHPRTSAGHRHHISPAQWPHLDSHHVHHLGLATPRVTEPGRRRVGQASSSRRRRTAILRR
jgi:hypothetical protein